MPICVHSPVYIEYMYYRITVLLFSACAYVAWIAAAVGVGLILVTVIVTLCVTYCICKGKRNPFCGFYDTSGSLPASTSGETSSGSYATGSYATGPYGRLAVS